MSPQFIDIVPPVSVEPQVGSFGGLWPRAVVLLGVSGSGKTQVGRYLSEYAGVEFYDVDDIVEARIGMPVAQAVICAADEYESTQLLVAREVLESMKTNPHAPCIVALGVSVSCEDEIVNLLGILRDVGVCIVELKADVSEVSRRLGLNAPRSVNLGAPRAMLTKMIAHTHELHQGIISVSVDTVGRSVAQVGQEVVKSL